MGPPTMPLPYDPFRKPPMKNMQGGPHGIMMGEPPFKRGRGQGGEMILRGGGLPSRGRGSSNGGMGGGHEWGYDGGPHGGPEAGSDDSRGHGLGRGGGLHGFPGGLAGSRMMDPTLLKQQNLHGGPQGFERGGPPFRGQGAQGDRPPNGGRGGPSTGMGANHLEGHEQGSPSQAVGHLIDMSKRPVCRHFQKGGCRLENSCAFYHPGVEIYSQDDPGDFQADGDPRHSQRGGFSRDGQRGGFSRDGQRDPAKRYVCWHFLKMSGCRMGDSCGFYHPGVEGDGQINDDRSDAQADGFHREMQRGGFTPSVSRGGFASAVSRGGFSPDGQGDMSKRSVCRHFVKMSGCRLGDSCGFYHPGVESDGLKNDHQFDFQADGDPYLFQRGGLPMRGGMPIGVPRGGMPIGVPRAGLPIGVPRGGMPIGVPRGGMPIGVPRGGMPIGVPRGGLPIGVLRGGMPFGAPRGGMPFGVPRPNPFQTDNFRGKRAVCRHFLKRGGCRLEDQCAFAHTIADGSPLS